MTGGIKSISIGGAEIRAVHRQKIQAQGIPLPSRDRDEGKGDICVLFTNQGDGVQIGIFLPLI